MELRCSCGTPSHSLPRSIFSKTPLGTPKNFFKCVKAKPDDLLVFRAGTLSRLKRLGLFRSCRREASPKTQGLSEVPPTMHESTKHPQRGRRTVSIDRHLKINGSGIPGSSPLQKSMLPAHRKSFRIDPFFKRGRRVQGGVLQRVSGYRVGSPAKGVRDRVCF